MSKNSPSAATDIQVISDAINKVGPAPADPFAAIKALLAALQKLQAQVDDLQAQLNTHFP